MDSVVLTQPTQMAITFDTTHISCNGFSDGVAIATVAGGTGPTYIYAWEGSSTDDTSKSLSGGYEVLQVTDMNACIYSDSILIIDPVALSLSSNTVPHNCFAESQGTAFYTVTGGRKTYSFEWYTDGSLSTSIGQPSDTERNLPADT